MKKYLIEYTSGIYCKVKIVNAENRQDAKKTSGKTNIYDITNITSFELETIKHYIYMLAVYNLKQWKQAL